MSKQRLILTLSIIIAMLLVACGGSEPEPEAVLEPIAPPAEAQPAAEVAVEEATAVPPTAEPEPTATPDPTATPEPTAIPEPTAEPVPEYVNINVDPGFYLYTNGNYLRDFTLYDGRVWTASLGGVLAWDTESGDYRKYTTLDGLPHVGIYGITACSVPEMTLLAATEDGLAAYDPDSDSWYLAADLFTTDPVFGLFGVSGQDIGQLVCDEANNRLIMEYNGVTILNLDDFSTSNVPGSELSWSGVRHLLVNGSQIWVSSGFRGYTILDGATISPFSLHEGTFEVDRITQMALAPNGAVWMAASEGVVRWQNQQTELFNRDNTDGFSEPYAVAFDPNGNLWIGFSSRLCQFDANARQCVQEYRANQIDGMVSGQINQIMFDENGRLYYKTFDNGWGLFDGENWRAFRETEVIPVNSVGQLLDDGQGYVWFLTGNLRGIDLEVSSGWRNISDMYGEFMVLDAEGNIWSTASRRLYQYDGFRVNVWEVSDGLFDATTYSIAVAPDGRIWVGQENGLSIWDGSSFTTITTEADDWPEGRAHSLQPDGDIMWVGLDKGLVRFDVANDSWEVVLESSVVDLPSASMQSLGLLPDGTLILGTSRGLVYYNHETRRLEVEQEVFDGALIRDIFVTRDGEILAVSASDQGGGLYVIDDEGVLHLTTADGLPTNRLRSVIVDSAGTVWIAGGFFGDGAGLVRIVP